MAKKPRPTLADYTAVAVSPALIMVLVGSLAYFLLEILYRGDYPGRLQWVLSFYIFGAVLVARMSMEFGLESRAPVYGFVLALVAWIGLGQFVDYPTGLGPISWVINAGLIAVVWWSTSRLTKDCTYIDEKAETTGTGLLQAAGLEKSDPPTPDKPSKQTNQPGWWHRYQRYRDQRKKTKPPGVWVVYFSLAALPMFGLGQSLIPPDEVDHRRYVFWLMGIYVASALGLLVTTAFLGLRRYLRQRNLEMPRKMTVAWLSAGGVLIVVLLVVSALLPRPEAEYTLLDLTRVGSKSRDASDYAMKDGEGGKGEGRVGEQQLDKDGRPVNTGDPNKKGSGGQGEAQGPGGGKQGQKDGNSGDNKEQGQGKGEEKKADADKSSGGASPSSQAKKSSRWGSSKGNKSSSSSLAFLGKLAPVLKWIVFGIIALIALVFLLRGGLRYLANFFDWARRLLEALRAFWEGLFGRRSAAAALGEDIAEERHSQPRPFRAYRNPFHNGRADEMSPAELVRYSFEAMEAWAFEHDLPRMKDETPIEFADRVGRDVPALENDAKRLAALYARVLYARGGLPSNWRALLEQFWEKLETVAEQPLSA
jgi:hypothetical protein